MRLRKMEKCVLIIRNVKKGVMEKGVTYHSQVQEKSSHKVWDPYRIQILLRRGIGKELS
jgi:hypothetical protein